VGYSLPIIYSIQGIKTINQSDDNTALPPPKHTIEGNTGESHSEPDDDSSDLKCIKGARGTLRMAFCSRRLPRFSSSKYLGVNVLDIGY
jgi:hypothetical protein